VTALAAETTSSRWLRVAKITLVFVVIAPLIASIVLFASLVIEGLSNVRYAVTLESAPRLWWSWLIASYMAGAPYALIVGAVFALLAVFAGWSNVWIAILVGLVPVLVIHLLPPVGAPLWELPRLFVITAIVVVVIASGICWALSRRWHGQPQ
jgi:hypothetical protein